VCLISGFATIAFYQMAIEAIHKDVGTGFVIFGFIWCAIFLVPTLREPFHGVVVTSTQVRVRNIMRTHVLDWDQIERFELAKYNPWPRIGVVALKGGRRVPMVGVQWAPLGSFAENTVAALNERLATMHGDVVDEGPLEEYPSERSGQLG
jgi:hypothetical protein